MSTTSPVPRTGRLLPASAAPSTGERIERIVALRGLVVEQILSGSIVARQDYLQDADEWVVVLAGAAIMEVDGERVALAAGDWTLLPAGVPHSVIETQAGTNWLAVHLSAG
jgi:cupin 2 domain-containing protein